ncbi:hypothetical protein [Cohnella sp. GCM10027633]|uniref:hypothetical protein n=1 Tax=unclassified Cohnella TaxID=2636738 RepID=UPI0036310E8C
MQVGDWVTAYNKGFFQVIKIMKRYYDESHRGGILGNNSIGEEFPDPMVVLKKGFTSSLKPSISWDTCAHSLCSKVCDEELMIIEDKFIKDEKLKFKFENFKIPPITTVINIGFNSNNQIFDLEVLRSEIKNGMTFLEIKKKTKSDLVFEYPHNSTIQLVNYDHEINEEKELIYRGIHIV